MPTENTETVITHCDSCKCETGVDCMESLCRCSECACEADVDGIEDDTRFALRMWKLVYGGGKG